jgi:large subunit ribosomal protein L24
MNRIKKGDSVVLIAGKDKGKRGEVVRVSEKGVFVQGLNMIKRHTKPNPQLNNPGGIIEREAPVDPSNVMLYNPASGKGERIKFKTLTDGRKVRVWKSGEVLDV